MPSESRTRLPSTRPSSRARPENDSRGPGEHRQRVAVRGIGDVLGGRATGQFLVLFARVQVHQVHGVLGPLPGGDGKAGPLGDQAGGGDHRGFAEQHPPIGEAEDMDLRHRVIVDLARPGQRTASPATSGPRVRETPRVISRPRSTSSRRRVPRSRDTRRARRRRPFEWPDQLKRALMGTLRRCADGASFAAVPCPVPRSTPRRSFSMPTRNPAVGRPGNRQDRVIRPGHRGCAGASRARRPATPPAGR